METNQTSIPETTPASEHPTEPTDSGTESHLILHEAPTAVLPLYPPEEAEHIASLLRQPYDPECVILFGSLAGGTSHSDIAAYDLLIIAKEEPYYGVDSVCRWLKLKMPLKHRKIAYINAMLYTQKFIEAHPSPVFFFARHEGTILYSEKHYRLKRPSRFDFDKIHAATSRYFGTFFNLGTSILEDAGTALVVHDSRLAAFYSAQAAMLFLRTLFFVYHGFDTDCADLEILYTRLRTLSGELMVLFDSSHYSAPNTIPRLNIYLDKARDNSGFNPSIRTVEADMDYVIKMKEIIGKACQRRITLYDLHRKQ